MDNLQAIMPMLIVSLAAMATMLAEAFRRKDERMPIGGLGVIGLVGAIAVVGGFMLLVWFGIQAALAAPDRFGMLLAGGIAAWFWLTGQLRPLVLD